MTEYFEPRTELRTPLQLVNEMDRALFYTSRGTKAVNELREKYRTAKEAYSKAFLQAKVALAATGERMSQATREEKAQLDNWDLFIAMNEAHSALQYAQEKREDLKDVLSKSQTESKLLIKEMEMAR